MLFHHKAEYDDLTDPEGIPMLNYHGEIGIQYNPISKQISSARWYLSIGLDF